MARKEDPFGEHSGLMRIPYANDACARYIIPGQEALTDERRSDGGYVGLVISGRMRPGIAATAPEEVMVTKTIPLLNGATWLWTALMNCTPSRATGKTSPNGQSLSNR